MGTDLTIEPDFAKNEKWLVSYSHIQRKGLSDKIIRKDMKQLLQNKMMLMKYCDLLETWEEDYLLKKFKERFVKKENVQIDSVDVNGYKIYQTADKFEFNISAIELLKDEDFEVNLGAQNIFNFKLSTKQIFDILLEGHLKFTRNGHTFIFTRLTKWNRLNEEKEVLYWRLKQYADNTSKPAREAIKSCITNFEFLTLDEKEDMFLHNLKIVYNEIEIKEKIKKLIEYEPVTKLDGNQFLTNWATRLLAECQPGKRI